MRAVLVTMKNKHNTWPMLSTPHAHTTYVDGINTPEEMVVGAIEKGFVSLGLSEHGRQGFDEKYCLSEQSEAQYIHDVLRVRAKYSDQLYLYLGIERDAKGIVDRTKFDYVIGSNHYVGDGTGRFAVDSSIEEVLHGCAKLYGGDWYLMARDYFGGLADFITTYKPDIIGHFDLVTKHNEGMRYFDETDARYVKCAMEALDKMAQTDAILEINTGAMARGYRSAPYPGIQFLKHWRARKGRVIISSDCHDVNKLDFGYDQAHALIKQAGFETAWALSGEGTGFVEYAVG